ncbi:GNAT family N-acetyltransferase [Halosimplex amylolyticum]|uniref:GNAT family N-acetyltransferase n=1 Tax=Halosimplex amylolyticum TaxID=3396616 RepID=UPI003F54D3D9
MLDIRLLTGGDVEDALALSTQAGWNQVAADWKRFLDRSPDGCFAGTVDGELVATAAVVTYGESVSWIGMVLVDEDHRGRGHGTQIFEHALEFARDRDGEVVGLDATDEGARIYRTYGFERVESVHRWQGKLDAPVGETGDYPAGAMAPIAPENRDSIFAFDRAQVGTDRTGLLRTLLAEPETVGVCSRGAGGVDGYAIARPGRTHWQVGPVVGTDASAVTPLVRGVSDLAGVRDVIVDAPNRRAIARQLEQAGLAKRRKLARMTVPEARPALLDDSVVGFVDFAFG